MEHFHGDFPQSFGLMEPAGTIKTQLAKTVDAKSFHWPSSTPDLHPLIETSLISFRDHHRETNEIGWRIIWTHEPILLKGNISHYYRSVIDGGAHGLSP